MPSREVQWDDDLGVSMLALVYGRPLMWACGCLPAVPRMQITGTQSPIWLAVSWWWNRVRASPPVYMTQYDTESRRRACSPVDVFCDILYLELDRDPDWVWGPMGAAP